MEKLTELEKIVLSNLVDSEYHSGEIGKELIGDEVWSFSLEGRGVSNKKLSGVCASLTKKGLTESQSNDSYKFHERSISLTEKGYQAMVDNDLLLPETEQMYTEISKLSKLN